MDATGLRRDHAARIEGAVALQCRVDVLDRNAEVVQADFLVRLAQLRPIAEQVRLNPPSVSVTSPASLRPSSVSPSWRA